jgi:hypothetical protein
MSNQRSNQRISNQRYKNVKDLHKKSKLIQTQRRLSQKQRIRRERQKMYDIARSRLALTRAAERLEKLFQDESEENEDGKEAKDVIDAIDVIEAVETKARHKLPSRKKINELEMMLHQMKKCSIKNKDIPMSFTELCLNNYQMKK